MLSSIAVPALKVKDRLGASPVEALSPVLPFCGEHWQIFEVLMLKMKLDQKKFGDNFLRRGYFSR
jgi:hypothetical protein